MGGKSDQEKASEKLYGEVSGFNPTAANRFDQPGVVPFGGRELVSEFKKGTKAGVGTLRRATDENVKTAAKSTTAGLQSRGAGGSILEDAVAKSKAKASGQGTTAINDLLAKSQQMLPGVMNQANKTGLALTGAQQGVDMQNIMNMFQKFASSQGAIGGLDADTTLDDILGIANTAGNLGSSAAAIFSDRRLKEHIVIIKSSPSGIRIFQFTFKHYPGT